MKITTLKEFEALADGTLVRVLGREMSISHRYGACRIECGGVAKYRLDTDEDVAVLQIETIPEPLRQGEARRLEDGRIEFLAIGGKELAAHVRGVRLANGIYRWVDATAEALDPITPETFDALLKLLREENK